MKRSKWLIPLKGGDEQDAMSGWRRVIKFRPGERKAAKRRYNRRARQQAKDLKIDRLEAPLRQSMETA